jgi:site-specific recombinase XerD
MIETLLKRSAVLARYQDAPYALERDAFLTGCAQAGYSNAMLKKIAWGLLAVADSIDLSVRISTQDIELAVDRRTHFTRQRTDPHASGSPDTRQLLIRFATQWVRSMGALRLPEAEYSPFTAQCEVFARYLREERGLSSVTIATRRERLVWFFRELNPSRQALYDILISDIDAFLEAKGKQGWTRASLSALAGSLRRFFTFAEARGWCAPGLAAVIESPRLYAREGLPEGPDWNVVQRLLASCNTDRPVDMRDQAIVLLLAMYGLRRGEVAGLSLEDLDWEQDRIQVRRPKQRLAQRYPLQPAVGQAILRYLREVRPRCAERALFLSLLAPIRPLSAASITALVHNRLSRLGLTLAPRGAHCLRHACASHLLASGFTLKQIGDHLGHRAANSTLSYTKVDLVGLRQVADIDLGALR